MNQPEIRELAAEHSVLELDRMIQGMITEDPDGIVNDPLKAEHFNSLVKAKTVRELVEAGLSVHEALRELGGRMRKGIGKERE